jgi:hypothetical protein
MNDQCELFQEHDSAFINRVLPVCILYLEYLEGIAAHDYEITYLYSTSYGFTMEAEINESCRCHPEYITTEFDVPWEWIIKYDVDPDTTVSELNAMIEERRRKEAERAKQKAERERLERERQKEERERKLLAELKLKYEDTP